MHNEKNYSSMTKTELIDHAETLGLSIPVSWTKERIISKINQKFDKSKSSAASNSSEVLNRIKFIEWLESNNLQKYEAIFSENDIELDIIPQIEDDDLREMGVSIGDRKRFVNAKTNLKTFNTSSKTYRDKVTKGEVPYTPILVSPKYSKMDKDDYYFESFFSITIILLIAILLLGIFG
jgi:hypothetical protein